ncbi:MAG: hypothetical protein JWN98_2698 [Abditibacteriota bacterium]|nr:hypothetical protein [Abditibacteriota bacterium]
MRTSSSTPLVRGLVRGVAVLVFVCGVSPNALHAQEQAAVALPSPLSPTELSADTALVAKVSFEVKRMPLAELVALLQKQSGITLAIAEDAAATPALVTARVQKMSLASVLGALQRMYGVRWSKTANGYQMRANDRGELPLKMLQTGQPFYYRLRERRSIAFRTREQLGAQLAGEVFENLDEEELRSAKGAPFSALSADLQRRVRDLILEKQSDRVVEAQHLIETADRRELYLRFGMLRPDPQNPVVKVRTLFGGIINYGTLLDGHAGLIVETDSGAFVTHIFPDFAAPPPLPPGFSPDAVVVQPTTNTPD